MSTAIAPLKLDGNDGDRGIVHENITWSKSSKLNKFASLTCHGILCIYWKYVQQGSHTEVGWRGGKLYAIESGLNIFFTHVQHVRGD